MTAPDWLYELATRMAADEWLIGALPPDGRRESAVLLLFSAGPDGPDVLLIERAATLREHAGQPAFPGGRVDPDDAGPIDTALREAAEEVGLDPGGVEVVGQLPPLHIPVSGYAVVPVLAWWRAPTEVRPVDTAEVAAVLRVPLVELAEPVNRRHVRHPSGRVGPAFDVGGLLVWGFTAGVLDRVLELGGWSLPWEPGVALDPP